MPDRKNSKVKNPIAEFTNTLLSNSDVVNSVDYGDDHNLDLATLGDLLNDNDENQSKKH